MHRIENGIVIIKPTGNLALTSPMEFKKEVLPFLDQAEIKGMIINCGDLQFIDSYRMGLMVSLFETANESGKRFALSNLSDSHQKLFSTTGLDKIIPLFQTEEQALLAQKG